MSGRQIRSVGTSLVLPGCSLLLAAAVDFCARSRSFSFAPGFFTQLFSLRQQFFFFFFLKFVFATTDVMVLSYHMFFKNNQKQPAESSFNHSIGRTHS